MGYTDAGVPALAESFPPAVVEYLQDFRTQEVRDIVETLLYIYIAQNSSSSRGEGQGVIEQSCYAYTSGPLFVLAQVGLIESASWHGTTVIKATPAGEAIARPLMEARIRVLDIRGLAHEIHGVVPALLAGTVKGSYVNKTFPSSLPRTEETFVSFLLNNNSALFEECEQFASRLKAAGCAVLAHAYDLDGPTGDLCQSRIWKASSTHSRRSLRISSRGCLKRSIREPGNTMICSLSRSTRRSPFYATSPAARTMTVSGRHRLIAANCQGCSVSSPTRSMSSNRCLRTMGSTLPGSSSRTGTSTTHTSATSGGR